MKEGGGTGDRAGRDARPMANSSCDLKSQISNPQSQIPNPSTFNLQPSTFNLQPSTFILQPSSFNPFSPA
jgi:hypothetical protein